MLQYPGLLHFSGMGREKHADQRARYAGIEQPLAGPGGGDAYAAFLAALRRWLGLRGLRALSWSFYGTAVVFLQQWRAGVSFW